MRAFVTGFLLAAAVACDIGQGTRPDATVISIRLRDDRGAPAGRNQVIVTLPASTRVNAQTRTDGTVDIGVVDPGVYRVWVIPRDGYISTDSLTKLVTVTSNGKVVVNFTLHRAGTNSDGPCVVPTIPTFFGC